MRERYYFLDGMRGVAAIMVTFYHFSQNTPVGFFRSAFYAVDLFFVLSGFVIAKAYSDRILSGLSFIAFLRIRLIRLYPMFFIGSTLGLFALFVSYNQGKTNMSIGEIGLSALINAFYLPYFNDKTINVANGVFTGAIFPSNSPAWSLFFEFLVNILFFFAMSLKGISKRNLFAATALSGIGLLAAIVLRVGPLGWGSSSLQMIIGFDRAFFGFCVGVIISTIRAPSLLRNLSPYVAILILLAIICLGIAGGRIAYFVAIIACPMLVWTGSGVSLGRLGNALSEILGEVSYPLYCIHYPVILIADFLGVLLVPHYQLLVILTLVAFCAIAAYVTGKVVDEPVRRWLTRKLRSPRLAPPPS